MSDWRDPAGYAYCAALTRDQWAWEFLRRNPDYHADYARFIAIWRALEADYGAPPGRDFTRWKADPRAYGPLPDSESDVASTGVNCTVDDDRVLLECWMGARWGYYKFPLAPDVVAPGEEALSWRPPPPAPLREPDDPLRLDLAFDLALPLAPQFDAARLKLASRLAELRRGGHVVPLTLANQRASWREELRLLDAHADGATTAAMSGAGLTPGRLPEALARRASGYRELLRLPQD